MRYCVGIDLGAVSCTAAVRRGHDITPGVLGEAGETTMPAVALPRADGGVLTGEAADRRSPYEPGLVARMVTTRLADPEPVVIDGWHCDPLLLTEELLRTALDRLAPHPGARPDHLVVTFPLRPGDASEPLLAAAAEQVVGPAASLVPAPIAAVAKLADDRDLGDEALVAVLDVGGSSVDATLVRRTPEALDLVGDPVSRTDLGGVDLDAVVLALVENAIGDITSVVTPGDYAAMVALRRVRASCRAAKERLSTETAAVVEVALPQARGRVEITREAFEAAAAPALSDAADVLTSAVTAAGLLPADLSMVLLTGGSSRIPLLRRMVAERTGLPVVGDEAPELTVALGAALFADAGAAGDAGSGAAPTGVVGDGPGAAAGAAGALAALAGASPPGADPDATVAAPPPDGWAAPATGELPAATGDATWAAGPTGDDGDPWERPTAGTTADGGSPWDGPAAGSGELPSPAGGGWAAPVSGELPAATGDATWADEPWGGDEPEDRPASPTGDGTWATDAAAGDVWDAGSDSGAPAPWEDARTSVFDPPARLPAADETTAAAAAAAARRRDRDDDEPYRRLRTSDTDPFGGRAVLPSQRRREREAEADAAGATDVRLVFGGVAAALIVVVIAAIALLSSSGGGNEPAIAVAETPPTASTTTTTAPSTTTSSETTTTTEPTTTTTEAETTTTTRRVVRTTTTATTAPPPTTTPPAPPTTRPRPTTTTTSTSTTTTTSSTTSTTVCEEPPDCAED